LSQQFIGNIPNFTHLQLRCEGILLNTRYHVAEGERHRGSKRREEHTSIPLGRQTHCNRNEVWALAFLAQRFQDCLLRYSEETSSRLRLEQRDSIAFFLSSPAINPKGASWEQEDTR
jgi:hypothetical protein